MNTANQKRILRLSLIIIGYLIFIYFIRLLNHLAFMISGGLELTLLYIMIQWICPCIIIALLRKDGKRFTDLGFTGENLPLQILSGCVATLFLTVVILIIPDLILGKPIFYSEIHLSILNAIYYICGVAASEEILIRGYIYTELYEIKHSHLFCTLVSSAIFGFYHIYGKSLHQMLTAAIFGIILCIFRLKFKNCTLLSLILAHGIYGVLTTQIFSAM